MAEVFHLVPAQDTFVRVETYFHERQGGKKLPQMLNVLIMVARSREYAG